jgi:Carboxypeptidase regulatory-like domain
MKAVYIGILAFIIALVISTQTYALTTFSVSGIVTDAEGIPLPGVSVTVLNDTNQSIARMYTSTDGRFAFENMSGNTSWIIVMMNYLTPTKKYAHRSYSLEHEAVGHIVIPDNETRYSNYTLPGKGYIYGSLARESDHMLMTGTVYLSNGKTREVTDPMQQYLFEVGPGNYSVYAVHEEDGKRLISDTVEVQALPAENKEEVPPVNLWLKPASALNLGALALALALGLAGILVMHYALRRLI